MTTYSLDILVCCSMSGSNCCFLTCLQISQEAGQVVWYSHLLKNFLQFIVIHTVKGFGIVNKAEVDVFLELSSFLDDPADFGNLISHSSAFSKSSYHPNITILLLINAFFHSVFETTCFPWNYHLFFSPISVTTLSYSHFLTPPLPTTSN